MRARVARGSRDARAPARGLICSRKQTIYFSLLVFVVRGVCVNIAILLQQMAVL